MCRSDEPSPSGLMAPDVAGDEEQAWLRRNAAASGGEDGAGSGKLVAACSRVDEVAEELILLGRIVWPILITSFLLYFKSVISMLFLGRLGAAELAGGSLAIAFANITGYSVLKGLAMGMEPICGQAFGACRWAVLSQAFQKTLLLLLLTAVPVAVLWLNVEPILLSLGQNPAITAVAKEYLLYSLPDLLAQALLHPLRIFLRTQNLTKPLTFCATVSLLLHIPMNYFFISYLQSGVRGVALAASWSSFTLCLGLMGFIGRSDKALKPWAGLSRECVRGWRPLVALALPSAVAVCLEWWWYEAVLLLCGLLPDAEPSVAAMGILIQTTGLAYVVPSSLGMGLSTRVGHELGARRPDRARKAALVGLAVAAGAGSMACAFAAGVRRAWGRMFTDEPAALGLTAAALPIVGLCELGNCPQTVGCGVLRGIARPAVGANINFGAFYLVGLPVAALAGFKLGLGFPGLWLGLVAAQAACVCLVLSTIARMDWEKEAERAEELTGCAHGSAVEKDELHVNLLAQRA